MIAAYHIALVAYVEARGVRADAPDGKANQYVQSLVDCMWSEIGAWKPSSEVTSHDLDGVFLRAQQEIKDRGQA